MLDLAAVVVVDTPIEIALDRLVNQRGMAPADAKARIDSQMDRPTRLAEADFVIDNSSDEDHLIGEVDRVWAELLALQASRS
jgi:dephospho-CoA kinase